jgi:3-hydroxymyristoyl/3-hydroxydecanoyl-(acyl carrier protein) dehydratase
MKAYTVESVNVDREGRMVSLSGTVLGSSDVFKHHFPGFPILPGVLMLDVMRAAAEKWYEKSLRVLSVKRVRFSNYLKPGASWQARLRLESVDAAGGDRWSGEILSVDAKMASAILTLSVKG